MNLATHPQTTLLPPSILWHNCETPLAANETALLTAHRGDISMKAATDLTERVTVYKITCLANGKEYIGISIKTEVQRFQQHFDHAMSGRLNTPLHAAIREFGRPAFVVEAIAVAFSRKDAGALEKLLIAEFDCVSPKGFNRTHGGEPDARWSDEAKAKNSASHKGIPWTDEKRTKLEAIMATDDYRAKMRAASAKAPRGPMSKEAKEKISAAATRQFADPDARRASSERATKLMEDANRRAAIRTKANSNWSDPDYKAKHAAAMAEVNSRPEYLANVGAATARRMADPQNRLLAALAQIGRQRNAPATNAVRALLKGLDKEIFERSTDAPLRGEAISKGVL